ncbi:MAG: hypothetical protein A3J06_03395 [Candidatus Moranbacteria bacterium RIFCSPLOWO2_02_FULL_48_19]|nr:MAG: hypothetical protein A3J06_03395 [Candidatus Moranbacteria bacterium RIFCSPLOWO2_02_FULL_48_19]OGI30422.1 MAG: hypothetical protein A3G09_01250 [Candidatus Moranbacteria bacterium RIFCSPLOWO2_12_FULL_48_12]
MIKLVVFDWNGTIIADTLACMEADNRVLQVFGGTMVDLKTYRQTMIIPAIDFYMQHGCNREELLGNSQRLGEVLHGHYEPRAAKVRTRIGARRMLEWLQHREIKAVILSNHTVTGINRQLQRLRIQDYFSEVLANNALGSSIKGRNKREKLEVCFAKSGLRQNEVLIVGDSPEEIEMGRYVGIGTVAITGGYYARNRLVRNNPDYLINKPSDLITIIEAIR